MIWQVFLANAGVPTAGLTPILTTLRDADTGEDLLGVLEVTVTEIGGGWYKLESDPTVPVVAVLDAGSSFTNAADRYVPIRLDPHDEPLRAILDGTVTVEQALRAIFARAAGSRLGGGTPTVSFLRQDGARVAVQLQGLDANGNTSTVVLDLG